jgi:hypothetical protein
MTPQNTQSAIRPGLTMSKMGRVKPKREPIITDDTFNLRKLDVYRQHWEAMRGFRKKRERAARYFNGEQWHEYIKDRFGNSVREDDYIKSQGQLPLIQNIIKPAIRSLEGQFRNDTSKSIVVSRTPQAQKESEMLSNALQYCLISINNAKELDARSLEEFLISGLPIQKISYERVPTLKKKDVVIRNIHPNYIFFNGDIQDIRGLDVRVIGQLHDYTLQDVILNFANSPEGIFSSERAFKLREIFSHANSFFINETGLDPNNVYQKDFYVPNDFNKCRVIEVWEERVTEIMMVHDWMNGTNEETDWTKEDIAKLNRYRTDKYSAAGVLPEDVPLYEGTPMKVKKWFYTFYSPYGHILREGETPFWHESHPFVMLPYPLLDGQVSGLVSDLIDPQRQVNRLAIQQDMILKSSIKNTLIIDKNSHDGQSLEDIAAAMKEAGGVFELDMDKNRTHAPFEISGANSNMGIPEMMQFYQKMMQDLSGVNPAMQGQQATSGTSAKLYSTQVSQSTMNSKDCMDSFSGVFRSQRDMKLLKTIQQYYDEPRMLAIAGKSYTETAQRYDPKSVQDIEFDLTIGQTSDSPVYRDIINERLSQFLTAGLIDLEMYLEQTTDPFSSSMLDSIRRRKEESQANPQAALGGLNQDMQQIGQPAQ